MTAGGRAGWTASVEEPNELPERFLVLYQQNRERIERFFSRMCPSVADAEDLVQDTFLHAFRGYSSFRGESKPSTWLFSIVIRTLIRRQRRQKREVLLTPTIEEGLGSPRSMGRLRLKAEAANPEEQLVEQQLRERLWESIQALPAKARSVPLLRVCEGLKTKDVGALLGLGNAAVKSRLHRARLLFRHRLTQGGMGAVRGDLCELVQAHEHKDERHTVRLAHSGSLSAIHPPLAGERGKTMKAFQWERLPSRGIG